jgi:hypothetical protein
MSSDRQDNTRVKYPGSVTKMLLSVNGRGEVKRSKEIDFLAYNSAQHIKMCVQRKIFLHNYIVKALDFKSVIN